MMRKFAGVMCLTVIVCAGSHRASAADNIDQAFRQADFLFDWRLRYESVDQTGFAADANALTSRLRLGFETAPLAKTRLLMEAVWVGQGIGDYNSTVNGKTQYPVVADPANFTALNRFAVSNQSLDHVTLTLGRQRIVLDNQRFVGNVGWRQNEQTFDGLRAKIDGAALKVDLTYANQVNRVFGPDSPVGTWHGDIVLANVAHRFSAGTLTVFDYLLDLDEAAAVSSNTVGARLAGTKPLGRIGASYVLAVARQVDAGSNPAAFDVGYYQLEGGLSLPKVGVALGYEVLGSDGANAFNTPLATLHSFQGWADKFLATPPAGIDDRYLKFTWPMGGHGRFNSLSALGYYHDFDADAGSAHFGNEVDLQLVARTKKIALALKYAAYHADTLLTDTNKLWLSVEYTL